MDARTNGRRIVAGIASIMTGAVLLVGALPGGAGAAPSLKRVSPAGYVGGNPNCSALGYDVGFKIDRENPAVGTYADPRSALVVTITAADYSGKSARLSLRTNIPVSAVFMKAGPGGNLYTSSTPTTVWSGLLSPKGSLSHLNVCWDAMPPPNDPGPTSTVVPPPPPPPPPSPTTVVQTTTTVAQTTTTALETTTTTAPATTTTAVAPPPGSDPGGIGIISPAGLQQRRTSERRVRTSSTDDQAAIEDGDGTDADGTGGAESATSSVSSASSASGDELSDTGTNGGALVAFGLVLLAGGVALVRGTRTRRTPQ